MATKTRGNGEGSIYFKKSHNKWCGMITVGKKPDGSINRKSVYGDTREEVKNKMTKVLADVQFQTYVEPTKITVSDWMIQWMAAYKKNTVKPSTYARYYISVHNHVIPTLGNINLQKLTSFQIQKLLNDKIENLSTGSVKKIYLVLNAALEKAVLNDLIYKNPCKAVVMPKSNIKPKTVMAFSLEQQQLFIEEAENSGFKNLFLLSLYTGARIGELLALQNDDIDFEKRVIRINKNCIQYRDYENDRKQKREISDTKTHCSMRNIPFISDKIEEIIKDQMLINELNKKSFGKCYTNNNFLFPTKYGDLSSHHYVTRAFATVCKNADKKYNAANGIDSKDNPSYRKILEGSNFHMLRHTFATRCLESGMNIKVVSQLLGHSKIQITLDTYSHVLNQFQESEIAKATEYFLEQKII